MAMDLNVDIGEVLRKLLHKPQPGGGLQHLSKALLLGFLAFSILLAYVFLYAWPMASKNAELEARVMALDGLRADMERLNAQKIALNRKYEQERAANRELTARFVTEEETEVFYDKLSQLAARSGLTLTLLKRGQDLPVTDPNKRAVAAQEAQGMPPGADGAPAKGRAILNKASFELNMTGRFPAYLHFLESLAEMKEMVQIDRFSITAAPAEAKGRIVVKSVFSVFRLPPKTDSAHPNQRAAAASMDADPYPEVGAAVQAVPASALSLGNEEMKGGLVLARFVQVGAAPSPPVVSPAPPVAAPVPDRVGSRNDIVRDPFASSAEPRASVPQPDAGAPSQTPPQDAYIVSGIVIGPNKKAALLQGSDAEEPMIVVVGSKVKPLNATIIEIGQEGIKLKTGKKIFSIPLQSGTQNLKKEGENAVTPQ